VTRVSCVICDCPTFPVSIAWFGLPPEYICAKCGPKLGRMLRTLHLVDAARQRKVEAVEVRARMMRILGTWWVDFLEVTSPARPAAPGESQAELLRDGAKALGTALAAGLDPCSSYQGRP